MLVRPTQNVVSLAPWFSNCFLEFCLSVASGLFRDPTVFATSVATFLSVVAIVALSVVPAAPVVVVVVDVADASSGAVALAAVPVVAAAVVFGTLPGACALAISVSLSKRPCRGSNMYLLGCCCYPVCVARRVTSLLLPFDRLLQGSEPSFGPSCRGGLLL